MGGRWALAALACLAAAAALAAAQTPQVERTGIENFVLNMKVRLAADDKEAVGAWARESRALNGSVAERTKVLVAAQNRLASKNLEFERARNLVNGAQALLNASQADFLALLVEEETTLKLRSEAAAQWSQKQAEKNSTRDASLQSMEVVGKIIKSLDGPRPLDSIADILRTHRGTEAAQNGDAATKATMTSVEKAAAEAAGAGLAPARMSEFRDLLVRLRNELVDHIESVNEDIVTLTDSYRVHAGRLEAELGKIRVRLATLRNAVKTNSDALPPLQAKLAEASDALVPLTKQVSDAQTMLDAEVSNRDYESAAFARQAAMRARRSQLINLLNQVVQEQLRSKDPNVLARLRGVRDVLPPVARNTTVDLPRVTFVTETRALSADEMEADMCGNWKFDEADGDEFAIDSSRYGQDGKLHGMSLLRVKRGASGNALAFDGMDDYVDVGRLGNFGAEMNNFTLSVWLKTVDTRAGFSSLLKTVGQGAAMAMGVDMNRRVGHSNEDGNWPEGTVSDASDLSYSPGSVLVYLRDGHGAVLAGSVDASDVFDGKWHHFQWTVFDTSKNNMAVWIDGAHRPFQATVEESPAAFRKFDANMFVGAADVRGTPMSFFDGAIDNVQFFCSSQRAVFGQQCCKICSIGKACGNDCIDQNATCARGGGCACDRADLVNVEKNAGVAVANATATAPPTVKAGEAAPAANSTGSAAQAAQQQAAAAPQQAQAAAPAQAGPSTSSGAQQQAAAAAPSGAPSRG